MRAEVTDLLQGFRFHATASDFAGDINPIKFTALDKFGAEAGFNSVTVPELTVENAEYREGTYRYTRKYPGVPTVSDGTLTRGIALQDTVFWDWASRAGITGEYRTSITIWHFHRVDDTNEPEGELANYSEEKSRYYICHRCLPIRAKPAADFDATSSEVSLAEVDFACEFVEVKKSSHV